MTLTTVADADKILSEHIIDYGVENIPFATAEGRVLAVDIVADRDLPPYNRVAMDGIAILHSAFLSGVRSFSVKATMAAGDAPVQIDSDTQCIEIMTGCSLPESTDTVVRYEDVEIENNIATIAPDTLKQGANIHFKGADKQQGSVVVTAGAVIDAAVISMAASMGQSILAVRKLPRVVIISTGDELVQVTDTPEPYQIRRSNSYTIASVLKQKCVLADIIHISDNADDTLQRIEECMLAYEVIILSGGVSMGKFDVVPTAMDKLGVNKLFHKLKQRPGKPFWLGQHKASNTMIFAFPGNPVSAFMCVHRYFIPWLHASTMNFVPAQPSAMLSEDFIFEPDLQYFLQVFVHISDSGQLIATPVVGNGSGDFSNLLQANAFMELPAEKTHFKKGEAHKVWPFRQIILL